MTENALETSEETSEEKSLLLPPNSSSTMETLKSNRDRQAPEAAMGHKPFPAPTQHPSVCAPKEAVLGRCCMHSPSLSYWAVWPERVLISPTFNTHTTTDKEEVHRVYQRCAVKTEKCSWKTPQPEITEEADSLTLSDTLPRYLEMTPYHQALELSRAVCLGRPGGGAIKTKGLPLILSLRLG